MWSFANIIILAIWQFAKFGYLGLLAIRPYGTLGYYDHMNQRGTDRLPASYRYLPRCTGSSRAKVKIY